MNPLSAPGTLAAVKAARRAAGDAIHTDDQVTVDDRGDTWVFEFVPRGDILGGGTRVSIAMDTLRVLKVLCGQ